MKTVEYLNVICPRYHDSLPMFQRSFLYKISPVTLELKIAVIISWTAEMIASKEGAR